MSGKQRKTAWSRRQQGASVHESNSKRKCCFLLNLTPFGNNAIFSLMPVDTGLETWGKSKCSFWIFTTLPKKTLNPYFGDAQQSFRSTQAITEHIRYTKVKSNIPDIMDIKQPWHKRLRGKQGVSREHSLLIQKRKATLLPIQNCPNSRLVFYQPSPSWYWQQSTQAINVWLFVPYRYPVVVV